MKSSRINFSQGDFLFEWFVFIALAQVEKFWNMLKTQNFWSLWVFHTYREATYAAHFTCVFLKKYKSQRSGLFSFLIIPKKSRYSGIKYCFASFSGVRVLKLHLDRKNIFRELFFAEFIFANRCPYKYEFCRIYSRQHPNKILPDLFLWMGNNPIFWCQITLKFLNSWHCILPFFHKLNCSLKVTNILKLWGKN